MENYKIESHLKSLWNKRLVRIVKGEEVISYPSKRSTKLIVSEMGWDEDTGTGSMCVGNWAYDVHYAFRDALDLSFDRRVKDRKPYYTWTQGYRIGFKEGDLIHSKIGDPALQVQSATPVSWDDKEKRVDLGVVKYEVFDKVKFGHIGKSITVNQMEFLEILINGQ